jgi:hypothetical protein
MNHTESAVLVFMRELLPGAIVKLWCDEHAGGIGIGATWALSHRELMSASASATALIDLLERTVGKRNEHRAAAIARSRVLGFRQRCGIVRRAA